MIEREFVHGATTLKELTELKTKLESAGIDTSKWGQGDAKTLEHLAAEIAAGETELVTDEQGNLLRQVTVGFADVFYQDESGNRWLLKEDRQEFNDGRIRKRDMPQSVSEKFKPEEVPMKAMIRGIAEELGIVSELNISFVSINETTKDSNSYPGLPSRYIRHVFRVELTDEQFEASGYVEVQADKKTYFVWQGLSPN